MRSCAVNTKACVATVFNTLLNLATGALKLTGFILTLGTSSAAVTAIKASLDLASAIVTWVGVAKNVAEKVDESLNYFAEIHDNPVLREILIQKVTNAVKDN